METLKTFNDNIERFNARTKNICQRVSDIFGVTIDIPEVEIEHPKRYNATFYSYVGYAQVCVQKSLGKLFNELDRYNLYHGIVSLGFSWSQIDEQLTEIETKLSKY